MAKQDLQCSVICLLLLVSAASVIEVVSASSRSLLTDGAPASSLRLEMSRLEPEVEKMSTTERVAHHVHSSLDRVNLLYSRIRRQQDGSSSGANWVSNVTSVPGGYAMTLSIGTPSQSFSVIADTGSDVFWVQGKGCGKNCFKQPNAPYDPSKSSSYKPLTCSSSACADLGQFSACTGSNGYCKYSLQYGDGSTADGDFSTETITLTAVDGGKHAVPDFAFGMGLKDSVDFSGVDGLVGLGQGPSSFPSQLGATYGKVFSYCLVNWNDSHSQASPIIFGSDAVPSGNVQYTPLQTAENALIPTFWFLTLNSVSVNGQKISVVKPEGITYALDLGTVIDSGTTVTFLDSSAYDAITESLAKSITYPKVDGANSGLDFCFDTSGHANPTFPGTTFHFEGADWVLPQENTFLPVDDKGTWCLAMLTSNQGIQIFGNIQQQNFHVVYDQPNAQLGWIKAQCDTL